MILINFKHRIDVYKKTVTNNAAGQRKPVWTIDQSNHHCSFNPRYSQTPQNRETPTYEQRENIVFFLPTTAHIDYGVRLYNLRTRDQKMIDAGPFEIVEINLQPGFTGKPHHYFILARRVIE